MSDPARPMLARVLGALTSTSAEEWAPWDARYLILSRDGAAGGYVEMLRARGGAVTGTKSHTIGIVEWTERDPIAALELLETRDLAPPRDDRRPWACGRCEGRGAIDGGGDYPERYACPTCAVEDLDATGGYRLTGTLAHPATLADVVAWCSLGAEQVATAEALAGAAQQSIAWWSIGSTFERVVWRVGERHPPSSQYRVARASAVERCVDTSGRVWWREISGGYEHAPNDIVQAIADLWRMGLAVDSISAGTVTLVVPPVGGG